MSTAVLGHTIENLRRRTPLVQCLTNSVVTNFTANVLLACGAAPAMVDVPGEAGEFAGLASAVLVNLGTPHGEQRRAMAEAVASARAAGTPWVLDPVAVGALSLRTELARDLAGQGPAVVRANASETMVLAGLGSGGRGVDATDAVEAAAGPAADLAGWTGGVVAVSGPVDLVTDGSRTARIHGGSELLTRVTGGGCALGALVAACVAFDGADGGDGGDALEAAVAAHALYAVAAETAATHAAGPGSFAVAFLDALANTTPGQLADRAVLS
jgi:hydroxyethylthiazole kinase